MKRAAFVFAISMLMLLAGAPVAKAGTTGNAPPSAVSLRPLRLPGIESNVNLGVPPKPSDYPQGTNGAKPEESVLNTLVPPPGAYTCQGAECRCGGSDE